MKSVFKDGLIMTSFRIHKIQFLYFSYNKNYIHHLVSTFCVPGILSETLPYDITT